METIIGYVVGILAIAISILIAGDMNPASIGNFVDAPSIFVVIGATIGAIFVAHPMSQISSIFTYFKKLISYPLDNPAELINKLVRYAELARKNGILALDGATDEGDDPFMAKGLQLAVDGIDPDQIKETMESELTYLQERHATGKGLFNNIGKYAPAFGMVGTLIGLVMMLKNLSDFNAIGPKMAVALITTFYGAVISNLFFLPAADKLTIRDAQEKLNKEIIINGVLSIQAGDNPRMVEQKLKVYLPPSLRDTEMEVA